MFSLFFTYSLSHSTATSWHLEGVKEEHIIATGIYYYDLNNVTDSNIEFRSVLGNPQGDINYPQGGNAYADYHYGLCDPTGNNSFSNSGTQLNLGKIDTKQNTCLVFPNFLQHRVPEFELKDDSQPGNRSILVFFLVDPRTRIPSTKDVVNNTMTAEEASSYRDLLMFHRKYEVSDQTKFYERGWSLCEH